MNHTVTQHYSSSRYGDQSLDIHTEDTGPKSRERIHNCREFHPFQASLISTTPSHITRSVEWVKIIPGTFIIDSTIIIDRVVAPHKTPSTQLYLLYRCDLLHYSYHYTAIQPCPSPWCMIHICHHTCLFAIIHINQEVTRPGKGAGYILHQAGLRSGEPE